MVVYPISLNRVPGCLFKITAKRSGGGGGGGGGEGKGRLSEGRLLIKGGTYQVFLSKKCNFESAKSLET